MLFPALLSGCAAAQSAKPTPTVVPALARDRTALPAFQRGVDIDAYTYPGQDIAAAAADIAYVKSLHANSVAISFPFFMTAKSPDAVAARDTTPTPDQLAVIVYDAQLAGLDEAVRRVYHGVLAARTTGGPAPRPGTAAGSPTRETAVPPSCRA